MKCYILKDGENFNSSVTPNPNTDSNPYYDQPRFRSPEEYDNYIKWRD